LVTLRELAGVGALVVLLQLAITLALEGEARWTLLPYLLAAWLLMLLMSQEFFVADWLRAHPLLYMLSHMFILPLFDFYLLAAAWQGVPADHTSLPVAFGWFLLATYANGVVFEIGRKVRAPVAEEQGVETYSALWGAMRASWAWWLAVVVAATAGGVAGWSLGQGAGVGTSIAIVMVAGVLATAWVAWRMAQRPTEGHSKWIERASAIWVLLFYLSMGLLPHLVI
jgi:4-hydroxybenzoate polyprenyltransferase